MARKTRPFFGKSSLARYRRGFLCHHIYPAETSYWCDPTAAVPLAHGKRGRDLRDLRLGNIVAGTPRRFLPSSKSYSDNLGNSSRDWTASRDDYRSNRFPKERTVSLRRMVLVCRHATPRDRFRPGWRTRPRGPLYVPPPHRSVCARSVVCRGCDHSVTTKVTGCCHIPGNDHRCPGVG